MKSKSNLLISPLIVTSLMATMTALAILGCNTGGEPAPSEPQQVVSNFYRWYIGYPGNPLADREYRHSPYLAESFVQEIDDELASMDRGGADPILLAQDVPERFAIDEVSVIKDRATVLVELYWGGNPKPSERQVELRLIDGEWKISGVSWVEP